MSEHDPAHRDIKPGKPTQASIDEEHRQAWEASRAAPVEPREDRSQPPPGFYVYMGQDGAWDLRPSVSTLHGTKPEALTAAWAFGDSLTAPYRERAEAAERALERAQQQLDALTAIDADTAALVAEQIEVVDAMGQEIAKWRGEVERLSSTLASSREEGRRTGLCQAAARVREHALPSRNSESSRINETNGLALATEIEALASPKAAPPEPASPHQWSAEALAVFRRVDPWESEGGAWICSECGEPGVTSIGGLVKCNEHAPERMRIEPHQGSGTAEPAAKVGDQVVVTGAGDWTGWEGETGVLLKIDEPDTGPRFKVKIGLRVGWVYEVPSL